MVRHLLISCVFDKQFWISILQPLNLTTLVPSRRCASLVEWWKNRGGKFAATQKGFQLLGYSWSMDLLEATECLRV